MLCSDSAAAVAADSSQGGLAPAGGAVLEEVECTVGAATTLLWNTGATCWLIHGGFAIATPTRMGNALGAGDADGARFVAAIGATLQVIPPVPFSFTLLRPCLAQFLPVFSCCLRVFTVSTTRFQRAASRNPGPRNGGTSTKSRELGPLFDTPDA